MSVRFSRIEFKNKNSIGVTFTVEAPVGTPIGAPVKVAANSTETFLPNINNCPSVLLLADDGTHRAMQTFAMTPPKSGEGRPAYLESVTVEYSIGDFKGKVQASAG